jgi:hypothetical protein
MASGSKSVIAEALRPENDGRSGVERLLAPNAIVELYLQLHRQPRSAWSHEIDVRP